GDVPPEGNASPSAVNAADCRRLGALLPDRPLARPTGDLPALRDESGERPCRKVRGVETVVEHRGAEEDAVDGVGVPAAVLALALHEPLHTADDARMRGADD